MGARLKQEQEQMLLDMYQHRINLKIEADEYTIIKIAEKLGCSMNTVWYRTRGLDWKRTNSNYVPDLEAKVEAMQASYSIVKATLRKLIESQQRTRRIMTEKHKKDLQHMAALQAQTHSLIDTIYKEMTT